MIIAGIVSYNPDIGRLKENIEAVISQVTEIVLVDNASNNFSDIELMIEQKEKVSLIANSQNRGIAAALNQLLSYAVHKGAEWLLSLDQDSVVPAEYVKKMMAGGVDPSVALLAPNILDRNDGGRVLLSGTGVVKIKECITSGTMMNIHACKKIGYFDEKMFIDYVDFEYCYRVKQFGYDIVRNNDVVLLHQLGNGRVASFLGKSFMVTNHSAIRHYYIVRNCVYLMKKHRWLIRGVRGVLQEFFIVMGYERDRILKMKYMFKGILDGVRM